MKSLAIIFSLIILFSYSSLNLEIEKGWGGINNDISNSIFVDKDKNIYIGGITNSFGFIEAFLLKFNKEGNLVWDLTWGSGFFPSEIKSIKVDNESNVYVSGITSNFGAGKEDVFIAKFNKEGNLVWDLTWGGKKSESIVDLEIKGKNLYIAGKTNSFFFGESFAFIVKFNLKGELIWEIALKNENETSAFSISLDDENNIYVVGSTTGKGAIKDAFISKISSEGKILWNKVISLGENKEEAISLAFDNEKNIYILGNTFNKNSDIFIIKFNKEGNLTWSKIIEGEKDEVATSIAIDSNNNIYIVGKTNSYKNLTETPFILKLNNEGNFLWSYILKVKEMNSTISDIIILDDEIYLTGYIDLFPISLEDITFSITDVKPNIFEIKLTKRYPDSKITDPDAIVRKINVERTGKKLDAFFLKFKEKKLSEEVKNEEEFYNFTNINFIIIPIIVGIILLIVFIKKRKQKYLTFF